MNERDERQQEEQRQEQPRHEDVAEQGTRGDADMPENVERQERGGPGDDDDASLVGAGDRSER